MENISIMSVL